ncbi:hypothetical protein HDK77DRAFT_510390 [Phyllosticta capitalensis]
MSGKRPIAAESVPASSAKRTRVENPGPSTASFSNEQSSSTTDISLKVALSVIPLEKQQELLIQYAEVHASLRNYIYQCYDREMNRRRSVVKSFDWQSKEVWKELNVLHRGSGSKEFDASFGVTAFIGDTVHSIAEQARQPSSFGTRANAIATLRKIGKSIALRNDFDESFMELAKSFSDSEKKDLLKMMEKGTSFEDKMEELLGLYEYLFPTIEDALDVLRGKVPGGGDDDGNNEEGAEEVEGE